MVSAETPNKGPTHQLTRAPVLMHRMHLQEDIDRIGQVLTTADTAVGKQTIASAKVFLDNKAMSVHNVNDLIANGIDVSISLINCLLFNKLRHTLSINKLFFATKRFPYTT